MLLFPILNLCDHRLIPSPLSKDHKYLTLTNGKKIFLTRHPRSTAFFCSRGVDPGSPAEAPAKHVCGCHGSSLDCRVGIMNAFRAHSKLQPHSSELEGFETHLSAIECCRTHPAQVEQNRVGLRAAERIRVQSSAAEPTWARSSTIEPIQPHSTPFKAI